VPPVLFYVVESALQSRPWKAIALKATHTTSLENFSRSPVPRQSIGWTPGEVCHKRLYKSPNRNHSSEIRV